MEIPTLKRNKETGLIDGIDYKFNLDGTINWRAMIDPSCLVIKKDSREIVEKQFNKKISEIDLREVEDKHILILLSGIKKIAQLRGIKCVKQKLEFCCSEKAACVCEIEFIPNVESSGESYTFSDVASASYYSTTGEFQLALEAIAANRAFVRCVRNALGINIVGRDEIDDAASAKAKNKPPSFQADEVITVIPETTGFKAQDFLLSICKKRNLEFPAIKKAAIGKKLEFNIDPETWIDFSNISDTDCYTIINHLTSIDESKKGKK